VKIVDKCEEKFLKVKEEVVNMVREIEEGKQEIEAEIEVTGLKTDNGFLIKE
jgi:hypothetical protein